MGIITEEVEIKVGTKSCNHYRNLGYAFSRAGDIIVVKTTDLQSRSNVKIDVKCDYCGEITHGIKYSSYNKNTKDGIEKYCCKNCAIYKHQENVFNKYGYKNISQVPYVKEKIKQTNIERYGVENVFLNENIQNKRKKTLIDRYGTSYPLQNEECFEKLKKTNMDKYGVEIILKSKKIQEKIKQTNLERYGCENAMQSQEVLEKWFEKNGSHFVKSSTQQQYLCNLYGGILNYPFKCFALDIYLPDDKLDIEFDGSGHEMSVSFGSITFEDFEKKEIYRNVAIKKSGIKQMRIISRKDYLPSDEILLQLLEYTNKYFSEYPNHSWINWDIDNSKMKNAENKDTDGVFFDFGELRKIKKTA